MDNIAMIHFLLLLLFLSVTGFACIYYFIKKRLLLQGNFSINRIEGRKPGTNYWYVLYDFFSRSLFTRSFLKSLTEKYEILYPGEDKKIKKKAMKLAVKVWGLGIAFLIVFFTFNRNLHNLLTAVFYLYAAGNEMILFEEQKEKKKLLLQFDGFLSETRQYYQMHGMIDEAVYEAMQLSKNPLRLHAKCFFDILADMEDEEKKEAYSRHIPDRFLKTFLNLCLIIQKYGDVEVNGQSLFITNIRYLRQEIHMEVLKRDKIRHLFSGLTIVAVFPVMFLKVIKDWAVSSLPQLDNFYRGTPGIFLTFCLFLLTLASYRLLIVMREERRIYPKDRAVLNFFCNIKTVSRLLDNLHDKNYGRTKKKEEFLRLAGESLTVSEFTLKSLLYGISGFFICVFLIFFIHEANKDLEFEPGKLSYATSALSEEKALSLSEYIMSSTRKFIKNNITIDAIEKTIEKEDVIKEKYLREIAVREIYIRVKSIRSEYFRWYELIAAITASLGFYFIPYGALLLLKKVRLREMEDEVFSFQSVILILMHMKRADISAVLEWMEEFSGIFRASLRECNRSLPKGEREALEELKGKEPFKPFHKLIEELQNSDKIGLKRAFDDIEQERVNYLEKRVLDNEMSIQEKAIMGKTIAFVPFALTVGLYIILPFVLEGLTMYKVYIDQINGP